MQTMNALTKFAAMLAMLTATACSQTIGAGSATEEAIFDVWQDALPTRSDKDTPQTFEEIGHLYDVFEAVSGRDAF